MKHVSSCQLSGWNNASESSLFMQKLPECDVQNLFYIELTVCIHWIQLFTEWRISVKTFTEIWTAFNNIVLGYFKTI